MGRFNSVTAIFGERGSGKTLYELGSNYTAKPEDKALNLKGILDLYLGVKQMKVLIIDTIDHPAYRKIRVMPPQVFKEWKTGVYRMFTHADDIPKLIEYLQKFDSHWNTCYVFEDSYKHTSKTICKPLIRLMGDTKQKNIDIFFMYWSFGQAPQDLFRMLDYIELFKTQDSPQCRKLNMPGYYANAMKIYDEVKASKNPFFHKTIETKNS
jgi:hypothetical protein